jgi:hypothetical protein
MKKYFISFGTKHNYKNSIDRIYNQAVSLNFYDKIIVYTEDDFDEDYLKKHENFMKNNKGYGYWMWKSYILKKTMDEMDPDDIVVYADCGCYLVNTNFAIDRLNKYIQICNNLKYNNLAFQMCFPEKSYTKMDLFNYLDETNQKMMDSGQLVGGIFIMKKTDHNINLVNEYYNLCQIYNLIDDSPSTIPNDKTFIVHRHDQSLFSILRKKRGCIIIPDETWFENFMSIEAQKKPILATRIRC